MAIIHFRCKERRRTVRVMLTVPLRVSGKTEIGEKFSVRAMSHTVSLHGASVELEQSVVLGEILAHGVSHPGRQADAPPDFLQSFLAVIHEYFRCAPFAKVTRRKYAQLA